ncbi:hypothetical protein [Arthrobacter sp. VKM Ac-2550]|uniref:hypothetical protein n=1 Tax=Crystallibacter permensis TaxID=1938888 RepID=UPI0022263988|nr:hypothetical protein [Arthrobacter sp. VKM Ac-2550]
MLPFIADLRHVLDHGGTSVVRPTGLAAAALAPWFLRPHRTEAAGVEARRLPG